MRIADYMTVKEASKILGISRQEMVRKIWKGVIEAKRQGKLYLLHKADVEALKRRKE